MFDKKSDYALNKRVKDAIVYISAAGVPVLLTRADFANDEEFQLWKAWSDGDYQDTERSGRSFYDSYIPLDEHLDYIGAVPSIEDELFTRLSMPSVLIAFERCCKNTRFFMPKSVPCAISAGCPGRIESALPYDGLESRLLAG